MSWTVQFSILQYQGQTRPYPEKEIAETVASRYRGEGYQASVREVKNEDGVPTEGQGFFFVQSE
jgi:hypothetical protein